CSDAGRPEAACSPDFLARPRRRPLAQCTSGRANAAFISLFADRQQRRVATRRRGVDGERALAGEAQQVVRAAGLGAGAGEGFATERLRADHRADLVAVDVAVADAGVAADVFHGVVDAAVHAERQAVAGGVDLFEHPGQLAA